MIKPLEIYRTDKGIWWIKFQRNGEERTSSLHTREKWEAKEKFDRWVRLYEGADRR